MSDSVGPEYLRAHDLQVLEYVEVTLTIDYPVRGSLEIELECPQSGHRSLLATNRPYDTYDALQL